MRIEILHIEDCPNWRDAERLVREALAITGHPDAVTDRLVTTSEEAAATAFAGSPTISVDGVDLFPTHARVTDLACRVYVTPDGPAGLPPLDQVVARLRGHDRARDRG